MKMAVQIFGDIFLHTGTKVKPERKKKLNRPSNMDGLIETDY